MGVDYIQIIQEHQAELAKLPPRFRPGSLFLFIIAMESIRHIQTIAVERDAPRDGDNHYAMVAPQTVIMAVATLEAGANEIIEWLKDHPTHPTTVPDGFDELRIEMKWLLLPVIAKWRSFDKSSRPWQDFQHLVALRNALVHPKGRNLSKTIDWLKQRGAVLKDSTPSDQFRASLTLKTAQWAVWTVRHMFHEMTSRVPKSWDKASHGWAWGHYVEPIVIRSRKGADVARGTKRQNGRGREK